MPPKPKRFSNQKQKELEAELATAQAGLAAKDQETKTIADRLKASEALLEEAKSEKIGLDNALAELRAALEEQKAKQAASQTGSEELGKQVTDLIQQAKVKEDLIQSMRQTVASLQKVK